jgi:tetratricopeptide (TPR) repeat protein
MALRISLYRLPRRQREIVTRYDLNSERVEAVCKAMALSRRQFFRDHRAALQRLAALLSVPSEPSHRVTDAAASSPAVVVCDVGSLTAPTRSLVDGLHNAGAYDEAIGVLRKFCGVQQNPALRIDAHLEIAELGVERGDVDAARAALQQARAIATAAFLPIDGPLAAHFALLDGHLVTSHRERQAMYERARSILTSATANQQRADGTLLVKTLQALSLSHDHRGDWQAAREAARDAVAAVERLRMADGPLGLMVRANYAMRDARQFGNVDAALGTLRPCLALALRNGWIQVAGDIAVHFINLNLMRSSYVQALRWQRWISAIEGSRLAARTRNFLAVDIAHALTMLGRPERALTLLQADGDEGLAFYGAREYWRAEALQARGDAEGALTLASRALAGAADADSQKGRARSKRVLARCHYALGHARFARKTIGECLELSEQFVSPYDLLLTIATVRQIERRADCDENELARLLRGSASDAEFGPPEYEAGSDNELI